VTGCFQSHLLGETI